MANEQNLKPVRSTAEAKRLGTAGGKKSGESRREKKKLRELLEILLQRPAEGGNGTNAEAMTVALFNKALAGDTKAFELIRDTIGEKPVEKRGVAMQTEVTLTKEQRDAVYRFALQAAMGGEYPA